MRQVSTLDELAAFVVAYCTEHVGTLGTTCTRAVTSILTADALPSDLDKRAALYGYADAIGATHSAGFDPAWKPAGCH